MTIDNEIVALFRSASHQKLNTSYFLKKSGFTLIELLVVIGILSIAVSSILVFLNTTIKGVNQANVSAEVKQNGQMILDSLERQIRGAIDAEDLELSSDHRHLKLYRGGKIPLHVLCVPPGSANGWIGTIFSTNDSESPNNYVSVTNKNTISGVSISACEFRVYQSAGEAAPPIVSVSFDVEQGINAPQREDFKAKSKFQTTISLRGY